MMTLFNVFRLPEMNDMRTGYMINITNKFKTKERSFNQTE